MAYRRLGDCLDLALDAVQFDAHELGVGDRLTEVLEAEFPGRDAVRQRADNALVTALLGLGLARPEIGEMLLELRLVRRGEEPLQRLPRVQDAQERPEEPVE